MIKKIRKIFIVLLSMFMLAGCMSFRSYVAYTVYPLGYIIDRITGGVIESKSIQSDSLVQVATILDDYEDILRNSNYLFHIGDLEPYYDIYEEDILNTGVEVVDVSELNTIYKFQRYTMVNVDGVEEFIESPYYNSDLFNMTDVNENDMMLWIDPIGMLSIANDIYSVLSANFVEEAASFKENYEALENDLISLDAAYQNLASQIKNEGKSIKFVSISASFGNWQKAYGIAVYPVCLSKYGALPSDGELAVIKERIKNDGVKYIAYEPNMTEEMTELFNGLEDELGLIRVNLNNVSSLTAAQVANNADYLSLMYENLSVLENMVE